MKPKTGERLAKAQRDVAAAKILLRERMDEHVLFLCEQCLEKTLKEIWVEQREDDPLRTHSLPGLIATLGLRLTPEQESTVRTVDALHIRTRYPDEPLGEGLDVPEIFSRTEELHQWLCAQMK